ncbi:hypothetical protein B4135_3259 [Caldibacillus debilis]|uniref:Uncharacterized protein n=1 Tax=Caldibacillus debilis TaxID=301148 RepID=A0A150LFT7_9BACI|nr:hypothetical protein B4135_3259 [Caldibacillus debilis]
MRYGFPERKGRFRRRGKKLFPGSEADFFGFKCSSASTVENIEGGGRSRERAKTSALK